METVVEVVEIAGRRWKLERPADVEALIDEDRFAQDEFLPYWAEPWPSGRALGEVLADCWVDRLPGARVLELGCGLGIPSLVAASLGALVTATDWSPDALALLARNAAANDVMLRTEPFDWTTLVDVAAHGGTELVLAADVLYEERNAELLLALVDHLIAAGADLLLADPGRRHASPFLAAASRRWNVTESTHPRLPSGGIVHIAAARRS